MYVTYAEYIDFGFKEVDQLEFDRLAKRASDVIDSITNYKLNIGTLDTFHAFIQTQVKKATSAQIEYFALNGGTDVISSRDSNNVKIGNFSYSDGYNKSKSDSNSDEYVPKVVRDYLVPTGLLYNGIGVTND